jgi:acetyl esterase/lipase
MKKLSFFLLFLSIVICVNAQEEQGKKRDLTHEIKFNEADFPGRMVTNVFYGSNVDFFGKTLDLHLDVFIPAKEKTDKKYPLFMWIHGGGFVKGDKNGGKSFNLSLAKEGFVVSSIDYRLGWWTAKTKQESDPKEAPKAIYRAVQDANAALRFLVAHADEYSIDPNWIFIGGGSAGGIASLQTAFLTEEDAHKYLAGTEDLGSLKNSSNDLKTPFKIKGVASMWGAADPDEVTAENAIPVIFFHGGKDNVVPMNAGKGFGSIKDSPTNVGSKPIYDKLTELGISTVFHVDPEGGHGVFTDQFRLDNLLCFLKKVMNGEKTNGFYTGQESSCK